MSEYNLDDFRDYDPIHEEEERYKRRNEKRPLAGYANEQRRRARRRKRIIHRTIVLTALGIAIILIVSGISSLFKSCSSDHEKNSGPSISDDSSEPSSEKPSDVSTEPSVDVTPLDFVVPQIADDNTDGSFSSYIYIYKNAGYTSFQGSQDDGNRYAESILNYKNSLPSGVKVYNMIVPSATEMKLPQRLANQDLSAYSQADFIKNIYTKLGNNVIPVNVYNTLAKHNDEYIYYNTDSHWTALGAYYGYCEFAASAGLTPASLDSMTKSSISGFTGDFYSATNSSQLASNPDTVDYYNYNEDYGIECKMQTENGGELQPTELYYPGAEPGSLTYGVFIWFDQPLFVIDTSNSSGKNILVVKDSYGNPLVPYLASNYDSVHVIDYRRWDGNLSKYCTENNITDVLFINEIGNAAESSQTDTMDTLFN